MSKTFITGNQRLVRGYSAAMAFIGVLILCGHAYYFAIGELSHDWYMSLIVGAGALISGLPLAMGWKKPVHPEIHLHSDKMEWKRNAWDTSFRWNKLDRVEFKGRELQVTYRMTGASDRLKIPFLTDTETMLALKKNIREACENHNITFITDKQPVAVRR